MKLKNKIYQFLKWLQNYTKTDMVYVAQGSFWWIFGRVFSFLAGFLILMTFARFVSKEVYGAYQYIISMSAMIGLILLPGLDIALIRSVAQRKEKTFFLCEKEKLKFGVFAFLIFCAISLWYFIHKNLDLALSFFFAGTFLPFLSIFSLYLAFWQGRKRFDLQNKYFVLHNLLGALILILFIILKPKITFIIFGYFFAFTFATFLFWLLTRKKIKKETEEDREAISYGKDLTIMSIPGAVSAQIDNVIMWQFVGPTQVAIYAYALRLVERISELIPFSALAFPKMAEKNLKEDHVKRSIFDKFLKLFWFSIFFTIFYILFCPIFFKIFFPAYKESIIYSQVLALILIFSPFSFLSTAFLAEAKKRELYILNFAPQILKIFLFFVLIPLFGIWGGVYSILISQIFFSALTLYFFQKL
jgi:O-antigen/teichoic acid export membrane protein